MNNINFLKAMFIFYFINKTEIMIWNMLSSTTFQIYFPHEAVLLPFSQS